MVGPLFDEPGGFDRDGLAARLRALAARRYLHRRQFLEIRRLARADLHARALPFARPLLAQGCSRPSACANTPRRFPRSAAISPSTSSPAPEFWSKLFRQTPEGFRFAFKVPEQITCKVFPAHAALRPAGRQGERDRSWTRERCGRCFCGPLLPYRAEDRAADLRIRRFRARQFRRARANSSTAWTRFWPPCRRSSATPWRSATPSSWRRTTSPACAPTAWRTCTTRGRGCRSCGSRWRFRIRPPPIS